MLSVILIYWHTSQNKQQQRIKSVQQYIPIQEMKTARLLETVLQSVVMSKQYQAAFINRNRPQLLAESLPLYHKLQTDHHITHFYFHDPKRVAFLRVHAPTQHGDTIERHTIQQAQRSGKSAYGLELGPVGTLTLRVVVPWYQHQQLMGYLELGKEIGYLLNEYHQALNLHFYAFIIKSHLQRKTWEQGMVKFGRPHDWNKLPNHVWIGGSRQELPTHLDLDAIKQAGNQPSWLDYANFESPTIFQLPLIDMTGQEIGLMVVADDNTAWHNITPIHITLVAVACVSIALILRLIYKHLLVWGNLQQRLIQSNATLRENKKLLQAILDNTVAIIFAKDRQGHYLLVNQHFNTLFHTTLKKVQGYTDFDVFPTEIAQQFQASDQQVLQAGHAIELEEQFPQDDGLRTYIVMKFPLFDRNNNVYAVGGIATDITQRTQIEAQLIIAKENAEKANHAKSEFLATMSHEIRTPLNAVLGLNEYLLNTETNPDRRYYLNLAYKGGTNLLALVNDILELSKIEANQLTLEQTAFNLLELVQKTTSMVHPEAREKGIGISINPASNMPNTCIGDPLQLSQVLLNLLGNAVKFTEEGEVTIEVKRGEEDMIHFRVADTGIGIAKEKQETIFQPFTQADSSITRRFGGTGLGLDICQRLAKMMGGEIWVVSELGTGSQFYFTAQLPESSHAFAPLTPDLPDHMTVDQNQAMHILLAEDVPENAIVIQAFLDKHLHTLDIVENGLQAVERFQAQSYDLVLMDIQMPIMDGFTATQQIRAWEKEQNRPATPILALTAHVQESITAKIREVGCDMHMTKPVSHNRLLGVIHFFSSKNQPTPASETEQTTFHQEPHPFASRSEPQSPEQVDSLNLTMLSGLLSGLGGNPGPINLFLEHLPQRVEEVIQTVNTSTPYQLGIFAHKLKGTARTFGADRLAVLCQSLEIMGKNGLLPEDNTPLEALKTEATKVGQAIKAYLDTQPSQQEHSEGE